MLEELTLKAGQELTKKMELQGKPVKFVRGEFDVENRAVSVITRIDKSRRRYIISLQESDIYNLLGSNTPVEVFGTDYLGHCLFGSEESEERYFRSLNDALIEERIGPPEYGAVRAEIRSRLNSLYRELFGDNLLNNRRRLGIDLLASAGAGLLVVLKQFKLNTKGGIVPILYGVFGFAIADIVQRYKGKREIIERHRIKHDTPFLGKYLSKATEDAQEPQKASY